MRACEGVGKIPCPYPGRIWLEQRGLQRAMYWHIEARVVLDLQEFINSENGGAHRCVVASITVKAPVREVWNILTAYETLPEIVPNLAISKILSRDNNKVRILQEGCKGLLYMVLHARVVLDLCEHLEQEISFE
ncbi:hypothetical protein RIF29_14980 [Crotalaria pallida]|uniref:Coenzyme Q-binding protein COQ10 START domain-containing protein n=1 Tax=Crotalaria pallida TaxID=3830 RepID=A0AAN9FJ82_CROPI